MLFDSPAYFLFLIPVVLLYWRLNHRAQNIFLLLASYFFYGWWDWRFLALMIGSTAMDFLIAQKIAPSRSDPHRRKWFVFSLVLNFMVLGIFKYFDFFAGSFLGALEKLGVHNIPLPVIRIILPPGISFYTFQEVAYIVDVYKGRIEASKSFLEYGLFISLFPHLIAGPIQRPGHLLPQVQKARTLDAERFFDGLMLIFSGLIRKCVVADNCAVLANAVFGGQLGPSNFWLVLLGTYAFTWQVYGDFSGYSDIARGSAQLLGFHFMVNFRQPFLANRLQDFWRRWHISLSTWLRDYLYIPLGGSAGGQWKTSRNLFVTMVLAGLWHGANWTFVIFGAIHGVALAIERYFFLASATPQRAASTGLFPCCFPRPFRRFLLPLGAENSDLQYSLPEPGILPGHLTHLSGATAGRIVPFRLADRVRRSILYALSILCTFVSCRPSAGSQQPRISLCGLVLCISNEPRGCRACHTRIFFREQPQCLCLFPILSPGLFSTRKCLLEFVPFLL